jgi:hypothetical protein
MVYPEESEAASLRKVMLENAQVSTEASIFP